MKILGVVTSFYPDIDELEKNINSFLSEIEHLIIWENTPKEKSYIHKLIEKLNNNKIEVRTTGQNEYLAVPFNLCSKWGFENGFTHLLTMDQDSHFLYGQFNEFLQLVDKYNSPNVAIFTTPKVDDKITWNEQTEVLKVNNAITSGTIYNLSILRELNFFREDLLIYMIDTEYGFRVTLKKYEILFFPSVKLVHQNGYTSKNKFGLVINSYSAQSTYFLIRNIMLMWKEYPEHFSKKAKFYFLKYKVGYRLLKLIFEPETFKKMKAVFLGIKHGINGKSGNYHI